MRGCITTSGWSKLTAIHIATIATCRGKTRSAIGTGATPMIGIMIGTTTVIVTNASWVSSMLPVAGRI
jgi:hypothetical protein